MSHCPTQTRWVTWRQMRPLPAPDFFFCTIPDWRKLCSTPPICCSKAQCKTTLDAHCEPQAPFQDMLKDYTKLVLLFHSLSIVNQGLMNNIHLFDWFFLENTGESGGLKMDPQHCPFDKCVQHVRKGPRYPSPVEQWCWDTSQNQQLLRLMNWKVPDNVCHVPTNRWINNFTSQSLQYLSIRSTNHIPMNAHRRHQDPNDFLEIGSRQHSLHLNEH